MARVEIKISDKILAIAEKQADKKNCSPSDIIHEAVLQTYCNSAEATNIRESLNAKVILTPDFDISANCLRLKELRCVFGPNGQPGPGKDFQAPLLKNNTIRCDVNTFEVLQYKEPASEKFDMCDYSLIDVFVDPVTGFASKYEAHFESKNFKGEWECKLDPSVNVRKAIADTTEERMELLASASDMFCTEKRTIDDAIIANKVAILSARAICDASIDSRKPNWEYIIANYHLQLAEFYSRTKDRAGQKEHLFEAARLLNHAHSMGLSGEAMYRTAYILTVFAIKRKDVQTARSMWGFLNKALQAATGNEKAQVNKYLPRVKDMYQDYALKVRAEKGEG